MPKFNHVDKIYDSTYFSMHSIYQIINADNDDAKYIINVKQFAKFVVDLAEQVASTDIEEGMRVGVDRNKYQIHIPLPPKIDPSVTMMQVVFKITTHLFGLKMHLFRE